MYITGRSFLHLAFGVQEVVAMGRWGDPNCADCMAMGVCIRHVSLFIDQAKEMSTSENTSGKSPEKIDETEYYVVFEYNSKADPGYRGARYRVPYENKAEFERIRSLDNESNRITDVVAEGVSDEESLALCERVDGRRLVASAIQSATNLDGTVNLFKLRMELGNVELALLMRSR